MGELVLKPVIDVAETEWIQQLLRRVECHGFRVAEPVPTSDGRWVHEGWCASRYIADLRAAAPEWPLIIEAGLRFCDAADRARDGDDDALATRAHRWAIADRVAWGEAAVDLTDDALRLVKQMETLWVPATDEQHFVHGDLSGNVFLDAGDMPVILDVSPYLRPRRWAAAIVIADAVLWDGAPVVLARDFASDADARDLFARALIFRLVAEQLADDPRHGALLEPYRKVLAALE